MKDVNANPSAELLSVQGDLEEGDGFRVYFTLEPLPQPRISKDASVLINVTDPEGSVFGYATQEKYDIPLELQGVKVVTMKPFPKDVANHTGTYKIDAWAIWGVRLLYLALEKMELQEREPQYPYSNLFPIGVTVALGGIGISVFGVKSSKRKKVRLRRRSFKR
ncbi:MAG: hypothetical protein ACE5J6_02240 [Candidatus Bathyarchaeia archaeon]